MRNMSQRKFYLHGLILPLLEPQAGFNVGGLFSFFSLEVDFSNFSALGMSLFQMFDNAVLEPFLSAFRSVPLRSGFFMGSSDVGFFGTGGFWVDDETFFASGVS